MYTTVYQHEREAVGTLGYVSAWKDETVRTVLEVAGSFVQNEVDRPAWGVGAAHVGQPRGVDEGRRVRPAAYQDARVQKIYGGSNEVLKDVVARSL